jgi:uncharacterized protein (TIGR02231 family)
MSRIIKVCVYPDRALITKETTLQGNAGENTADFTGITPRMESDSLRVKGRGDLVISDSSLSQDFLTETNLEELNLLEEKIEELNFKLEAVKNRKERIESLRSFLNNMDLSDDLQEKDTGSIGIVDTEGIQKFLDQHAEIINDITQKTGSANIEIKEIKKDLKRHSFSAEKLKESSHSSMLHCKVNFKMEKPGEAVIRVSYIAPGASWSPLYDGRLLYSKREFELVQYAEVLQNTGEDWNDVKLELSTARPSTGALLPEPEPWHLDIYQPPPLQHKPATRMKKLSKTNDDDISLEPAPAAAGEPEEFEADMLMSSLEAPGPEASRDEINLDDFATAEVSTAGFHATFISGASHDIPTGGSPAKVMLGIEKFPAEYEYIAMPAVEEATFLKIKVKNCLEYPVLKGPVKIYRDFSFLGESEIENIVPGEELELFMGADDSIKVTRDLMSRNRDRKGLTGKDTSIEYEYRITVESFKESAERVKVIEQIPVSMNKEVDVKFRSSGGFNEPDEKGIIRAEFMIKPKEKIELGYTFSVRHPSDTAVYGIERS